MRPKQFLYTEGYVDSINCVGPWRFAVFNRAQNVHDYMDTLTLAVDGVYVQYF